jgi:hypothetical protein
MNTDKEKVRGYPCASVSIRGSQHFFSALEGAVAAYVAVSGKDLSDMNKQMRVCPRSGSPFRGNGVSGKRWFLACSGLASLIWFLVRVVPKPSRASYPCQRAAASL